jgi:hypothetical protein
MSKKLFHPSECLSRACNPKLYSGIIVVLLVESRDLGFKYRLFSDLAAIYVDIYPKILPKKTRYSTLEECKGDMIGVIHKLW